MESKAIVYEQPHKGFQFPMVLTAFDGDDHEAFDRSGYRGRYVMFTFIEGGIQECVMDHHDIDLEIVDEEVKEFVHQVFQGWRTEGHQGINWADLEDGGVYDRDDFSPLHGHE